RPLVRPPEAGIQQGDRYDPGWLSLPVPRPILCVITGLDPVIHSAVASADMAGAKVRSGIGMDRGPKSGNDGLLRGISPDRHSGEGRNPERRQL
ncbi:MAG: hypothetical protein AB7L41_14005, partial [Flavobacteriaceae bacterium]